MDARNSGKYSVQWANWDGFDEKRVTIFIDTVVGMIEAARSAAEAESDAEDLIVESESDSDQSNQGEGQRSVQTGATAGSDSGEQSFR